MSSPTSARRRSFTRVQRSWSMLVISLGLFLFGTNGWVERARNALLPGAHQGRREVTRNAENQEGGTATAALTPRVGIVPRPPLGAAAGEVSAPGMSGSGWRGTACSDDEMG